MSKSNKQKQHQLTKAYRGLFQADLGSIRDGARSSLSTVAHDYLNQLVDCSSGKAVGAPTLIGGAPGRTQVTRQKGEFDVSIGSTGLGFFAVNLAQTGVSGSPATGPFNDTPNFMYTNSSFNDVQVPTTGILLPAGVLAKGFEGSPWSLIEVASASHEQRTYLNWRAVAAMIKVTNISAVLTQNGLLAAWSPPNNQPVNNNSGVNLDLTTVENFKTSRVVRAQNDGDLKDHLVLNWHPHAYENAGAGASNDFEFISSAMSPGSTGPWLNNMVDVKDGLIVFRGTPGQTFHISVSVIYELKGTAARSVKPRLVDSRGMDLVFNTIASKSLSGYVGDPRHVADGYLAKAWELSKKLLPKAMGYVKEHEDQIMKGTGRFLKGLAGLE